VWHKRLFLKKQLVFSGGDEIAAKNEQTVSSENSVLL